MSDVWKGSFGPHITRIETRYDAETLGQFIIYTYEGSEAAINGLGPILVSQGLSFEIFSNGPIFTLQTAVPIISPDTQSVDRYEIATVSIEVDIYQNEFVWEDVYNWDVNRGSGQRSYQTQVEDYIQNNTAPDLNPGVFTTFYDVVANIRGGVRSFSRDYLSLRRYRRVDTAYATGGAGRINLKDGRIIYSTAQLNLPSNVAFVLPSTPSLPTNFAAQFQWGWKLMDQRVELVGSLVEQGYDLLFAPHSLLDNTSSTSNLAW